MLLVKVKPSRNYKERKVVYVCFIWESLSSENIELTITIFDMTVWNHLTTGEEVTGI